MLNYWRIALLLCCAGFAGVAAALPDIQHWNTAKGARVLYVYAPELPMVDVRLVFDAGAARDGDHGGVARLTNALLDQGAAGLGSDDIARGFEQRGAILSGGAERDMAWLSLRCLTDPELLEPTLELFGNVLSKPDFPRADFKRERKRMLVGLQYQKQKPGSIAGRAFYDEVFGEHPYAGDPSGREESVAKLKVATIKDFYRRYYVARNAVVVIVGNVSEQQAKRIAAQLADGLEQGERAPALPDVAALDAPRDVFVEFPSSQSHVLVGAPGVKRKDPDYFALYVGNHILGGSGLVSRISEEIREKRGLSYSAYSYFVPMARKGPFTLGFQTRNDQRQEALSVLRHTLQGFIDKGPTQEELDASVNNIVSGFPMRVASNSKIAEYLAVIGFYDLPNDYLQRFNEQVQAVTLEQIRDAFRRRVDPQRMVTVVVGGAEDEASGS